MADKKDNMQLINYRLDAIGKDILEIKQTINANDDRYVLRREYDELKVVVDGMVTTKVNKDDLTNIRILGYTVLGGTILALITAAFTILTNHVK